MLFSLVIYIFTYDLLYYFMHKLLHTQYLYQTIHKKHHLKHYTTLTYTDAYMGHVVEKGMDVCIIFIPNLLLTRPVSLYDMCIIIAFIVSRGCMKHDKRWEWLVGRHHLLHHKHPHYNYGEYWMDYICGSAYES